MENKYPIIIDGGKTIIFITDQRKEIEIRQKYETRKVTKAFSRPTATIDIVFRTFITPELISVIIAMK